ncbi:MAG: O-methyltransferase family 3 [Thermoleophilia bacterium]|nr:O-methyltransferase family 3 [Thermoleophilia bacterium]
MEDPEARVGAALGAVEDDGANGPWVEGYGIVSPEVVRYAEVLRETPGAIELAMRNVARSEGIDVIDEDAATLLMLHARALHPRRVLEVGTGIGLLTLHLARAVPEDCTITSIEADPLRQAQAHAFLERETFECAAELRLGDAIGLLHGGESRGEFDMVVLSDPQVPRLGILDEVAGRVATGGLLVVPFALRGGRVAVNEHVWNGDAMVEQQRLLNRRIAMDARFVDVVLLPVGDGLLLARRR